MTTCKHADSGCNYPEGECAGVYMQRTPEELKAFAIKHAPVLAEEMTRLCGSVIAKGMQGILQEVCRIQQERDQLLAVLKMVQEAAIEKRGDDFNLSEKQWAEFHAAMSKATRSASHD